MVTPPKNPALETAALCRPGRPAADGPGRDAVPAAASAPDGTASGDTQAGAAFARWVMDQDPQQKLITAAVVRNDTNLSVKVNPTATKTDVQNLLVALAQGMARTFPGKPVTVDGYYQSGDKLATATYDPLNQQVAVQWLHYQNNPDILQSLLGNKLLMLAIAGLGAKYLADRSKQG